MQERIIKNAAKCLNCSIVIESKFRTEHVTCKCKKISISGGRDYLKRTGEPEYFADLSVVVCE